MKYAQSTNLTAAKSSGIMKQEREQPLHDRIVERSRKPRKMQNSVWLEDTDLNIWKHVV